nr:unnamed protein product [Naegleria fowleri]
MNVKCQQQTLSYFQTKEQYATFKKHNHSVSGAEPRITVNSTSKVLSFQGQYFNRGGCELNLRARKSTKKELQLIGAISDLGCSVTVSSTFDRRHSALHIALNSTPREGSGDSGSWCAKVNDQNQWVKVYFGEIVSVYEVAIQGRSDYGQ